jgi:hypothetical protein
MIASGTNIYVFGGIPLPATNQTNYNDTWSIDTVPANPTNTRVIDGITTVNASSFTRSNFIFTAMLIGGKLAIEITAAGNVPRGTILTFVSIYLTYT